MLFLQARVLVLGALIIFFLIAEPDGLVALWDRLKSKFALGI